MKNRVFDKAISSLLHPISIAAICLLLWNDHWLRLHYPSWWTGKIGDFAWLVFAPFVCAAVIAWLVPRHLKNHQQIVGTLAFSIIGAWFGFAKTVPAIHALTVSVWETVINGPVSQRLDPSDLIALPALLLSWHIWRRATVSALKKCHLTSIIFGLAIAATLASDDPYYGYVDAGITTICAEGGNLVVYLPAGGAYVPDDPTKEDSAYKLFTSTDVFTSIDGGQNWQLSKTLKIEGERKPDSDKPNCSKPQNFVLGRGVQYRWQAAQTIERSTDTAQHWLVEKDLYELRQDVRHEYKPSYNGWDTEPDTSPGPRSGLIDPVTGNVVLAMGWDGVLVRTSTGQWLWASVGEYGLDDLANIERVKGILFFEEWEAGGLIILVFTTSAVFIHRWIYRAEKVIVALGWIGWTVIGCILLPGAHRNSDGLLTIGLIALPLLLLAILLVIFTFWDFVRYHRRLILPVLGLGLGTAILYLFPFIFWTQGTIARYVSALELALLLTVSALIAGYNYLNAIVPKTKRKHGTMESDPA